MADEKITTVSELRGAWDILVAQSHLSTHVEITQAVFNFQTKLIDIIEAQDARIKALEALHQRPHLHKKKS